MPAGGRSSLRPGVRGKPRRGRVGPGRAHSLSLPGIDARSSLGHGLSRTIMGIALTHAGGVGEGERRTGSLPARSKVVGVWETGEGERVPPPRGPPPPVAISPRSTAWGDPGEEPDTAAPLISQALPLPPRRGRGRSAEGAGGVGLPAETWGYLYEGAGGVGLPAEACGYLYEGVGGVGANGRSAWVSPTEGAGGVGAAGEVSGYPS